MCNFIWTERKIQEAVARRLNLTLDIREFVDCFGDKNPTDTIAAIFPDGMKKARFGLIPRWSKEVPGVLMTQARSETLEEKPAYRGLMKSNRCLVPVAGFYEWYAKQKTALSRADGEPMYFAALWDEWEGKKSVTLITTEASDFVRGYQDRMPLILESSELETWLYGSREEAQALITERDPVLSARTVSGQGNLFD
ncbi:MAG: SOS response-associated peptidase [Fimbriimonadaceae bacterium]|nr:SOS response-associated peptidase [Fimbriimonadaceae bacterium]